MGTEFRAASPCQSTLDVPAKIASQPILPPAALGGKT